MTIAAIFNRYRFFSASLGLLLACNAADSFAQTETRAIDGVLDLRQWNFEKDGVVELSGAYEFYWLQHVSPKQFSTKPPKMSGFIKVPGTWNNQKIAGVQLTGQGYATYRLTVLIDKPRKLAFKFFDMGTTYKVFVNGEVVLRVGKPGVSAESTIPRYFPKIVEYNFNSTEFELVFWVSNFHHRKGGAWEVIELGLEKDIRAKQDSRFYLDFFLFNTILVMGLYHIGLFVFRNKDIASLYFGIFCLLIAVRFTTQGEIHLIRFFSAMPWEFLVKIEYLSFYLAPVTFTMFLYSLYHEDFSKIALLSIQILSLIFCAIVLFTPVRIFSHTIIYFQFFTIASCSYGITLLVICATRKREGAKVILAGFFILFLTILHDILEYNKILQTPEILPFGILAFILFLTSFIAFRFAKAFKTIELQKHALSVSNEKYSKELTERKRAEKENRELQEKLTRSQKMEAIGLLAGGVAHDLNNILAGIVAYPDLLLSGLSKDSSLKEPLETIKSSGLQAAAVVQDLLTLSRRGVLQFEVVNLNEIILDYLHSPEHRQLMLEHPSIDIEQHLEPDLLNIRGSHVHLKKTIMNLVVNAAEAQPKGGTIKISTTSRYIDSVLKGYEDINEGTYVVFRIEDQGAGIVPEDLKKIFEPFYSRKLMGRSGTGLGMTVVWGTVHDHNGYIDILSSENKGTVLELFFPATSDVIVEKQPSISIDKYKGNKESILVVDDISQQREIASKILERLGYRVETAASGEEAVAYLEKNDVKLMVLDMIMEPGIDGLETFKQASKIRPTVRAVIASGYSESEQVRQAQKLGAGQYLKKPYSLQQLGLAVRAELDR